MKRVPFGAVAMKKGKGSFAESRSLTDGRFGLA